MAITKITTPELFNLQSNNTEGTQLPVMTTTEREAMTGMSNGELIFNSTTDSVEYYDAGVPAWYKIDYEPPYPTSLKMFLDANNLTSNPGSGTIWTDLTTNSNNGALVQSTFQSGTPKYVNIPGTNASTIRVDLAGSGGTTQVTNLVGGTQPLTVQGYAYFSSSGSSYDYFFCFGNASGGTLVSVAKENPSIGGRLYIYDRTNVLYSTFSPSVNTWYNIALTVTGTQYKLYVNGVLEYSPTGASKNITTNTAQIGSYSSSAGLYGNNFTGRVGEFRIYHDVLPAADILANFNATKATYGL